MMPGEQASRRWNRRILLERRPNGLPQISDFAADCVVVPDVDEGEALVRVLWLSIDGFMVGRLRAEENYTSGVQPGDVMQALAVGEVIQSRRGDRSVGDIVCGQMGMQQWYLDRGNEALWSVDPSAGPLQSALGILGVAGWSAYFGLLDIGRPRPGETVAVSAATGGVGALAGQIARIMGCRTIAIVGTEEKARIALQAYGYDSAVVRRDARFESLLKAAAPDGIDVYFDNAGGDLYDAVLAHMRVHGRIVVCGRLASAHLADTSLDIGPRDHSRLLVRRLCKQGFLVTDFASQFSEATAQLAKWQREHGLHLLEDVLDGIDMAPLGLVRNVQGQNTGKQLIRLTGTGEPDA
ncbi:MAG: NADP-dependent oxidoreductase [Sandaracinobacter sp.]